jgi:serine protease Do
MKTQKITPLTFLVILSMIILPACSGTTALAKQGSNSLAPAPVQAAAPAANPAAAPVVAQSAQSGLLASFESTLENIYTQVNPSVVNIQVVDQQSAPSLNSPFFGFPGQGQNTPPQSRQALGAGFVWDTQGYIVTNNHVIDGATQIQVSFADGTTVPAKVVGADVNSDLAVIKVDVAASELHPVTMADSSQTKVGQLAVAIGSPFGNQGTMTVGIISAIGRSLPVNQTTAQGASYSIPDVIQTDAPINPGNSGGVLLNDLGQVVGVTAAIESPTQASAGIGYAIPSEIVQKVIPVLIKTGHYDHPYLGISGTTVTLDLANAMNLSPDQHGALVEQVVPNGPADKAGLLGSNQQVTINGQAIPVGGDVITAIDGQSVKTMDDVIAYLTDHTDVGQKVTLTILRNGKEMSVEVTLQARPSANNITSTTQTTNN